MSVRDEETSIFFIRYGIIELWPYTPLYIWKVREPKKKKNWSWEVKNPVYFCISWTPVPLKIVPAFYHLIIIRTNIVTGPTDICMIFRLK